MKGPAGLAPYIEPDRGRVHADGSQLRGPSARDASPGLAGSQAASVPTPELMVREAPAFGMTPTQKRAFDVITNNPNIPREHLALWLAVSEGRVRQVMHGLMDTWGLVEPHGGCGNTRYMLSGDAMRYIAYRDRSTLETTWRLWSAVPRTDPDGQGPYEGNLNNRWSTLPEHTRGLSWALSKIGGAGRTGQSGNCCERRSGAAGGGITMPSVPSHPTRSRI